MVRNFFDLDMAYDTTKRYEILMQLRHFGLRGRIPKLIQGFIRKRNLVSELILPTPHTMNRRKEFTKEAS